MPHEALRESGAEGEGNDAARRLAVSLRTAPGVEFPAESFQTAGLRFNDAGELVEILPPPGVAENDPCQLHVLIDPLEPRTQFLICAGDCIAPDDCLLLIDLGTLTIACDCV